MRKKKEKKNSKLSEEKKKIAALRVLTRESGRRFTARFTCVLLFDVKETSTLRFTTLLARRNLCFTSYSFYMTLLAERNLCPENYYSSGRKKSLIFDLINSFHILSILCVTTALGSATYIFKFIFQKGSTEKMKCFTIIESYTPKSSMCAGASSLS